MRARDLVALTLLPALAACSPGMPPSNGGDSGGVAAPTSQVSGQYTGTAPITSVKPVFAGTSTVRGPDVPVTNGAFTYALPTDASITSLAAPITPSTFGAAQCAGTTQTVSNPSAQVVQLAYFDTFNGTAAVGHTESGQMNGNTTTIYLWMYASAAVDVKRSESCTVGGHGLKDSIDLHLAQGWNSVVGTNTVAADGSVTSTYYTQPVGTVPFL